MNDASGHLEMTEKRDNTHRENQISWRVSVVLVGNATGALGAFGEVAVERLRARCAGAVRVTGRFGPRNGGEIVTGKRGIAPDAHRITSGAPREARNRDDVGAGLGVNNRRGDDREEGDGKGRRKGARSAKCDFHGSLTSNKMHLVRPNREMRRRNGHQARKRVATGQRTGGARPAKEGERNCVQSGGGELAKRAR